MIYDELRNYLVQAAGSDVVDFFDNAIEIFDDYDVPDYLDTLELALLSNTKLTDAEIVDRLMSDAQAILRYLLTMQGIELVEEILPTEIAEIARGLFSLRYYEDQDTILSIVDSEQTNEETISELLCLTTTFAVEKSLSLITNTHSGFFDGLKERMKDISSAIEEEVRDVQTQIKKYIAYRRHLSNASLYSDRFFAQLGSIGLPLASYLNLLQKDNLNQTGQFDIAQIAKDLVGLALLSDDGHGQPLIEIRKHLNQLIGDVTVATKVDIAVCKLTVEVDHAQA